MYTVLFDIWQVILLATAGAGLRNDLLSMCGDQWV